jgi:hypothetical protein
MATLLDIQLAYDGHASMLNRVKGACIKLAGTIRTESVGTTNHANRLIWAAQVESDPKVMAQQMIGRVLGNPTIATSLEASGDGLIETVVGNLIDIYATGV